MYNLCWFFIIIINYLFIYFVFARYLKPSTKTQKQDVIITKKKKKKKKKKRKKEIIK